MYRRIKGKTAQKQRWSTDNNGSFQTQDFKNSGMSYSHENTVINLSSFGMWKYFHELGNININIKLINIKHKGLEKRSSTWNVEVGKQSQSRISLSTDKVERGT